MLTTEWFRDDPEGCAFDEVRSAGSAFLQALSDAGLLEWILHCLDRMADAETRPRTSADEGADSAQAYWCLRLADAQLEFYARPHLASAGAGLERRVPAGGGLMWG